MTEIINTPLSAFSLVTQFHLTFGQPIRTVPELDVPERALRLNLIEEEAGEYKEAVHLHDFIEEVDALGDLVYVAVGAALTHGVTAGAEESTIRHELEELTIEEAVESYRIALTTDELANAIGAIIQACYQAAQRAGVDLDGILDEIQRSNMSKLGADGKPIYREDGKVLKGPGFFVPDIEGVLLSQGVSW